MVTSIGVVLGAGGVVGAAYHAGVLTALAEAGFDSGDADVIVGTSAGSAIGALLRAGFPARDLAARYLGQELSVEAAAIVARSGGPPTINFREMAGARSFVPASPGLAFRAFANPIKAMAGLLPTGTVSTASIGERMAAIYGETEWPAKPLWICAVDLDSGQRIAFGQGVRSAPIATAVQASSAIPGLFQPVMHGGKRYVDGGVHSPTNADLLADGPHDLVVVVSPMSATRAGQRESLPSGRPLHAQRLANEVRRIRRSGTQVLTFQPTPDDVAVMGRNPMDVDRREATVTQALTSAREHLADPAVADRLALLNRSGS